MEIRNARPVSEVPQVTLVRWRIMRTETGKMYFVGARADKETARVSSPIISFDPDRRRGVTQSKRIYQLEGEPDFDHQAEGLWKEWCVARKIFRYEDITLTALSGRAANNTGQITNHKR
ncbi:hypothetical protein AYM40_29180 [Paraburkholderia phytofirmans OLGA172]|uniref:Uncharacterized protein n=1 Tax=Paraburkholderia phytofirmans OLGA172 TaxID=1417228 RepID=A0A160FTL6_9BURK|nr:hypothetical protein AYM40_29180 [Paraburkholderia phytofirmans OLGA172]